jgi:hypothetical protein
MAGATPNLHWAAATAAKPRLRLRIATLRRGALRLFVFSGFFVFVEPSPYEVMFLITGAIFLMTGLRTHAALAPLAIGLTLFNLGGAISLVPFTNDRDAVMFITISFYMALTCLFFACLMLEDTAERLNLILKAWTPGAAIAGGLGILGALDVFGLVDTFARYGGRASGTFKDPNVLGPFLCMPAVFLVQSLLLGKARRPWLASLMLLPIVGGIFFTFSRGAWAIFLGGAVMTAGLCFLTTQSARERRRIIFCFLLGAGIFVLLLLLVLSDDSTRALFETRAALTQDYDVGVGGRFGNQAIAINMLLSLPNGFGPMQFPKIFHSDPHNVYVDAFAAYGWLGGVTYFTTILMTCIIGWGAVLKRTPWQRHYIALWSVTFLGLLQGFQIDTDHWRHLWLEIGLVWGAAIATFAYARTRGAPASSGSSARPGAR